MTVRFRKWGLGNQLFQLAGTYALSRRHGVGILIPSSWHYRGTFSVPDDWFRGPLATRRCAEAWPLATGIDIAWRPHLQDVSLWLGLEEEIRSLLQPSAAAIDAIPETYAKLLADEPIAIHVRRGDYLDPRNAATIPCPRTYYDQAIEIMYDQHPQAQAIVFSDDIEWCRQEIRAPDAVFAQGNPGWLDLAIMARCAHHICANSTFSWWGAFLSGDPKPIVPWVEGTPQTFRRIYPEGWRLLEVEPD